MNKENADLLFKCSREVAFVGDRHSVRFTAIGPRHVIYSIFEVSFKAPKFVTTFGIERERFNGANGSDSGLIADFAAEMVLNSRRNLVLLREHGIAELELDA